MENNQSHRILVIGCGSIGRRHIRNLKTLGVREIYVHDTDRTRSEAVAGEFGVEVVEKPEQVRDIIAVIICNPSRYHLEAAQLGLGLNAHLFIEKPVADSQEGVQEFLDAADSSRRVVMVGFNLRYHPCLRKIKSLLDADVAGQVLGARVQFGQYLPDWHPWEDYRRGYSANRRLGGGVILDRIHELDYTRWLLGEVSEVTCVGGKLSKLEIDTEDFVEILFRCKSGAIAELHLDYVQRTYTSMCQIIGDQGNILWDYNLRSVRWYSAQTGLWQEWTEPRAFEINQTYLNEMETFLGAIDGKSSPPVDGREGLRILQLALAAGLSMMEARTIRV